jgi:hypothetical protein
MTAAEAAQIAAPNVDPHKSPCTPIGTSRSRPRDAALVRLGHLGGARWR